MLWTYLKASQRPQWLLLLGASNITTLEPFQNPRNFLGCACVLSCFSPVWLFATLWAVTRQAPLSLEYSRPKYWGGLPISYSRESPHSRPRSQIHISCFSWTGKCILYLCAPGKSHICMYTVVVDCFKWSLYWRYSLKRWGSSLRVTYPPSSCKCGTLTSEGTACASPVSRCPIDRYQSASDLIPRCQKLLKKKKERKKERRQLR